MSERVTLRLEDFDDDLTNEISFQGPIKIFKTVETESDLFNLPNLPDFPIVPDNEDNLGDLTKTPDVVVFVKNVTGFSDNLKYRGAYFRYSYLTDSWQEILLGTHSHENKDVLDKIGSGDIGNWRDLTDFPSVKISEDIADRIDANTNSLFLHINPEGYNLYRARRESGVTNWDEIPLIVGTSFPLRPSIREIFFNTDDERLFIFSGASAGERKMLVLEVTDPDNTDLTYSYEVNWEELPPSLPIIPEETTVNELYLGLDSGGNTVWKNSFVASQIFQFKQVKIVSPETNGGIVGPDEQIGPTQFISVPNIMYNQDSDEVLVLDGSFFLTNRNIAYNKNLKVLTVTTNEDAFDIGATISILIIRNGAAAVLDELAAEYVTKADAINLLSGGSVNLKNYATKTDLQTRASRNHTHSQFSKIGHNHDMRYANFKHTHEEYLTRRKALELIEETVNMNPDILNILQDFSDYLENGSGELETLISGLASHADIALLQAQIDQLNSIQYKEELVDFVQNNVRLKTDQIDTEFIDEVTLEKKNLEQFLYELYDEVRSDLNILDTDNVLVKEDIQVRLGENKYVGGINDGDVVSQGLPIQEVLRRILRRRVLPEYNKGQLFTTFTVNSYPEFGSTIPLVINSSYQGNDSGSLTSYRVFIERELLTINIINTTVLIPYSDEITVEDQPITIKSKANYARGPLKYDNFGEPAPFEEINNVPLGLPPGETEINSLTITPVRAIFMGGISSIVQPGNLTVAQIRSVQKYTAPNYNEFGLEVVIPPGTGTIIFAMPVEAAGALDEIEYREQFYQNILPSFSLQQKMITDASGARPILYNVYSFKLPFLSTSNMHLKFIKR
jgi:hypothetical protein